MDIILSIKQNGKTKHKKKKNNIFKRMNNIKN